MTARSQGYLFVLITMCIWGGFTILSRLNLHWHISAWDLVAMRFAVAFIILMPILIYKKDLAFLWHPRPVILALTGGLAYCLSVYTAFLHAPAAHAAIFLNGCIPLCTAVAAYLLFRQPFDRHTWLSLSIMLLALTAMSGLMYQETGIAFSLGDGLFFLSAVLWGTFTVLLRQWKLSAWHSMAGVAVWAAIIFVPIYVLFLPKTIAHGKRPLNPMSIF